jgi:hypothetical protein
MAHGDGTKEMMRKGQRQNRREGGAFDVGCGSYRRQQHACKCRIPVFKTDFNRI